MSLTLFLSRSSRLGLLILLGLCSLISIAQAEATTREPLNPSAHLVRNILGYVRWPHAPYPLRLCVVPPSASTKALLELSDNSDESPLRTLLQPPEASALKAHCDFIYIGNISSDDRHILLNGLIGQPVLTLTESPQGCSEGSLFCIRQAAARASFTVNLDAIARSGLYVHPQVLQLGSREVAEPTQ